MVIQGDIGFGDQDLGSRISKVQKTGSPFLWVPVPGILEQLGLYEGHQFWGTYPNLADS